MPAPANFGQSFRLAFLPLLVVPMLVLALAPAALAQSVACTRLNQMLQSIDANGSYGDAGGADEDLRALQANEANAERAYSRTGCQAAQDQRLPQTPQCHAIAAQILAERAQISQLSQGAGNGAALARQRQQILQQLSRYQCVAADSGASFSGDGPASRRNFLQQLFGGDNADDSGGYGDDDSDYQGQQALDEPGNGLPSGAGNTIRTVCVRKSDGYYWPISYSTTSDYIPQDTATCQAECPNQQVDLYFYANPGQGPEQMVDAAGDAYSALPNAFAYRKAFDLANACQTQGAAEVAAADGVAATSTVTVGGTTLPLPRPDPRRDIAATAGGQSAAGGMTPPQISSSAVLALADAALQNGDNAALSGAGIASDSTADDTAASLNTIPDAGTATEGAPSADMSAAGVVPLPRPRPGDPGDGDIAGPATMANTGAASPAVPATAAAPSMPQSTQPAPVATRVVKVGDKLVRIVGPQTPYAPLPGKPG